MKTKQEQIEEMAKDIYSTGIAIDGTDIAYGVYANDDHFHRIAQKLYFNNGYRKASEVIDEFVERLKEENEISFRRYGKGIGISTIFRIAAEMRQEVEK